MVGSQIGDLLRRARTLEWQRRLREHRPVAGLQLLQTIPGVGDVRGGVIAAHAVFAEGLRQSRYLAPVELHAGADHKIIIGQSIAILETNRVLFRLEGLSGIVNPTDADGIRLSSARRVRASG